MKNFETTNSGLKVTGDWDEICSFSEQLGSVIEDCLPEEKENECYKDWRPREEEDSKDLKAKTAEEASMDERKLEEDFRGTEEEFQRAKDRISKTMEDIKRGSKPEKDLKKSSKNIGRIIGVKSIEAIRKMERVIYEKLMLKFNPYYFDTEDFSVNIQENKKDDYVLTINIPDESLRDKIVIEMEEDK